MIPVIPRLHFGLPMQCQPRSERRWKPDALARSLGNQIAQLSSYG